MKRHHWVIIIAVVVLAYLLLTGTLQNWLASMSGSKKQTAPAG